MNRDKKKLQAQAPADKAGFELEDDVLDGVAGGVFGGGQCATPGCKGRTISGSNYCQTCFNQISAIKNKSMSWSHGDR